MLRRVIIPFLVVVVVVGLIWIWHEPATVNAQSASNATNPTCTSASQNISNASLGWSPYPLFACVADLDANGNKEIIVGVQNTGVGAGAPGTYKITIINHDGTVRATVTLP